MFAVEPEENGGEESFGLPHRSQRRRRVDGAGPAPFEKIGDHAVEGRGDERQRELHQVQALRRAGLDQGLIQDVGWRHPGIGPDVAQVCAEQAVEFLLVVGIEIVAVPPEPVAAFGGVELCRSRAICRCEGNRVLRRHLEFWLLLHLHRQILHFQDSSGRSGAKMGMYQPEPFKLGFCSPAYLSQLPG
jgi:hypothetical protein